MLKMELNRTSVTFLAYRNFKFAPKGTIVISCWTSKLKKCLTLVIYFRCEIQSDIEIKNLLGFKINREDLCEIKCHIPDKRDLISKFKDIVSSTELFTDEP